MVKLPLIFAAICAELVKIPVDLGRVVFIFEPSPKNSTPSTRPKEPVDVAEPEIEDENSKPLKNEPDITSAICAELDNNPGLLGNVSLIAEPSP